MKIQGIEFNIGKELLVLFSFIFKVFLFYALLFGLISLIE